MNQRVLVIPDQHAHPDSNNDRADWLGDYIKDSKPNIVVNIGDCADMPSLSGFDKGKSSFVGRSYEKDIEAHLDFQERLWAPSKKTKKKQPYKTVLIGNHEQRLQKVIEYQPELVGATYGVSWDDFDFKQHYHEVIPYEGQTPGIWTLQEVDFAHYFISGLMGRPVGGEHHASSLLGKNHRSSVCGHSHTADFSIKTSSSGHKIMGLVAGVYQDYKSPWAGHSNNLWWSGVVMLNNFSGSTFDPEFISLESLKEEYE